MVVEVNNDEQQFLVNMSNPFLVVHLEGGVKVSSEDMHTIF
jgi:hypothetical protein